MEEQSMIAEQRIPLTRDEIAAMGMEIVGYRDEIEQLEEQKKAAADLFKSQISGLEERAKGVMKTMRQGWRIEEVEADVIYNHPVKGMKTIIKKHTQEVIRQEAMTDQDRQMRFRAGEFPIPGDE